MNIQTRKRAQYISLAVLCLLAAGLWLAAPALAGSPAAQTPAVGQTPAAPAAPTVAPAPAAPYGVGNGYGYGEGEGSGSSYLGIDVVDITPESAKQLKLKEERGAEITMVDQDAPAGKAGLQAHDVILEFDGQRVEGVEQLRRMIHETPPGRTVTIAFSRDGQMRSVQAQLAGRVATAKAYTYSYAVPKVHVQMPRIEMPAIQVMAMGSRAGLLVSNVTAQLGEYFGCKNGECVLVQSVEKGSPAEAAGFKAGDVILKVDNERITDMSDWRSALRGHRGGGKVAVIILRERREQTLSLDLPATRDSGDAFQFEMPGVSFDTEAMERELEAAQHSLDCAKNKVKVKIDEAELRRAMERAQREYQRAMKQHGKEMEREMKQNQKELELQLEQLQDMQIDLDVDPDFD